MPLDRLDAYADWTSPPVLAAVVDGALGLNLDLAHFASSWPRLGVSRGTVDLGGLIISAGVVIKVGFVFCFRIWQMSSSSGSPMWAGPCGSGRAHEQSGRRARVAEPGQRGCTVAMSGGWPTRRSPVDGWRSRCGFAASSARTPGARRGRSPSKSRG